MAMELVLNENSQISPTLCVGKLRYHYAHQAKSETTRWFSKSEGKAAEKLENEWIDTVL